MFSNLTYALGELLHASDATARLREAEVNFERPGDSYKPVKDSVNLFLFDVRERADLRNSAPVVRTDPLTRTAVISPAATACRLRLSGDGVAQTGQVGEAAMLQQHRLLADALSLFVRTPLLAGKGLSVQTQAWLEAQPYVVELTLMQSELTKNVAEFWSAVGGKLRPSFTLTATVAMVAGADALPVPLVDSRTMVVQQR